VEILKDYLWAKLEEKFTKMTTAFRFFDTSMVSSNCQLSDWKTSHQRFKIWHRTIKN
jgi:hypothetical protein